VDAPPPPLHIPATPYFPLLYLSTVIKLRIILAPLAPIGCPKATAPPLTLTLLGSKSNSLIYANPVTLNASLNSQASTSVVLSLYFSNNFLEAYAGAMLKSIGASSASYQPIISANGSSLSWLTSYSLIKTKEQAPSFNLEALAAVTVPFLLNTGFKVGIFSCLKSWTSSS
jgi:hypothetical protein